MENTKLNIALQTERNEEVQHIIDRMPTRFGFWVSMIVFFIFVLMLSFGWLVRYPDVVNGQIIINANSAPVKLISNSNGKLHFTKIRSMGTVKTGEIIAYVENSTNPVVVNYIDSIISLSNPNNKTITQLKGKLPENVSLGELNDKYYSFISALQKLINYDQDNLFGKQEQGLNEILLEQKKSYEVIKQRLEMGQNTLNYIRKFYVRDSGLLVRKVISESELDKSHLNYISAKDAYQNSLNNLINTKQQIQQTLSKLQELGINKPEKEKEIRLEVTATYNVLIDNIKNWELKYVFRAPFDGRVQFLKFYTENQFVQLGEEVFTVVPKEDKILGQVILPAQGSGKVKEGQEVIVKLDNYPYLEYGSITGTVNSISLITSTLKSSKADIDTYQVLVNFPNQLITNYGAKLAFRAEAKGNAEIITNDRRLVQRLFDNLKYIMKK
ncbi:HlyD family efflux transporter periplasmic adaptor subunit [Pedobacter cryoconitis]|uniref:HlyD family efflux transporter periplasmic adaptor subunit n=1 Tax=Pedobacter cryoconitis TaxID=188932 RepID=UPI00161BC7DB|nr:HlyD family efflux transporter periplasmic adaptor subunit [Pedobacter cryoconitis]MBB5643767.1 hypothetical protein [Pedobacter cryoconitis]